MMTILKMGSPSIGGEVSQPQGAIDEETETEQSLVELLRMSRNETMSLLQSLEGQGQNENENQVSPRANVPKQIPKKVTRYRKRPSVKSVKRKPVKRKSYDTDTTTTDENDYNDTIDEEPEPAIASPPTPFDCLVNELINLQVDNDQITCYICQNICECAAIQNLRRPKTLSMVLLASLRDPRFPDLDSIDEFDANALRRYSKKPAEVTQNEIESIVDENLPYYCLSDDSMDSDIVGPNRSLTASEVDLLLASDDDDNHISQSYKLSNIERIDNFDQNLTVEENSPEDKFNEDDNKDTIKVSAFEYERFTFEDLSDESIHLDNSPVNENGSSPFSQSSISNSNVDGDNNSPEEPQFHNSQIKSEDFVDTGANVDDTPEEVTANYYKEDRKVEISVEPISTCENWSISNVKSEKSDHSIDYSRPGCSKDVPNIEHTNSNDDKTPEIPTLSGIDVKKCLDNNVALIRANIKKEIKVEINESLNLGNTVTDAEMNDIKPNLLKTDEMVNIHNSDNFYAQNDRDSNIMDLLQYNNHQITIDSIIILSSDDEDNKGLGNALTEDKSLELNKTELKIDDEEPSTSAILPEPVKAEPSSPKHQKRRKLKIKRNIKELKQELTNNDSDEVTSKNMQPLSKCPSQSVIDSDSDFEDMPISEKQTILKLEESVAGLSINTRSTRRRSRAVNSRQNIVDTSSNKVNNRSSDESDSNKKTRESMITNKSVSERNTDKPEVPDENKKCFVKLTKQGGTWAVSSKMSSEKSTSRNKNNKKTKASKKRRTSNEFTSQRTTNDDEYVPLVKKSKKTEEEKRVEFWSMGDLDDLSSSD